MKLTTKLTLLFVLLTTIPLAIVDYLAYDNGRRTIEQDTINRLISTNIYKEAEFERWVKDNERSLRDLARRPFFTDEFAAVLASHDPTDPEYQAAHRSIHENHLDPTLEEEGGFLDLSILRGDDGLILVSTDEGLEGRYKESEPFFLEGKNRTYVENVTYCLTLGEAVMHISTPIKDREGNLIAVLAGHADLAEMSDIMEQRSGLSASEGTYLVNQFNFFVTEPLFGEGYALKKALHTEGVAACLQHNDGVGFYDDYRDLPVIGAYRWLPERELCILTEEDQAEAYAPIVALRNTVLGIGVGVGLLVALLGLLVARTITTPVQQLVEGAEEIGRGNLDYRIEVVARDEIGQLAGAFNDMAARRLSAEQAGKRAEQSLRESEQWLSTTLRSIGDAVIATDAQGLVTLMNPVAEELTGWDETEAVGKPLEDVFDIINEQTGERAENPAARVLREGVVVGLANHTVLIAKDGTKRPIADSGAPMRDEEGNIIGTVMVFRDITERRRAEEELRRHREHLEELVEERTAELQASERKYRTLVENIPQKIFAKDRNSVYTSVNENFARDLAITPQEFVGKTDYDFFPKELADKYRADDQRILESGETEHIEERYIQDGQEVWVHTIKTLVRDEQGQVVGILGVFWDITERKQAEEALKEYSERLEEMVEERTKALRDAQEQLVRSEKLAVLGQLAGGVGHELRNPLGAIKNAAYFLHMVLEKPEPDVAEMLQILDREVGNCERIISSLLDFAQPRELALRQVHLPEVIEEALARTTVPNLPAQAGNVEVLTRYAEALPLITADPDQLGLVFGNLILNAVQAMPGGGRLTITAAYVEGGTVRDPQSAIRIQVSDTGVGIPEEHLGKIFEPLFTTKAKGIGLGLAVSKTLVERHGGSMEVTSEVGKGSTFTVRLPLAGERGS